MTLESQLTEQQLFDQLISSIVHNVWVALGKIKNPVTDKIDRDLNQASISIDMLDMLYKRMHGNLSEMEDKYLSHILGELKMNFIEEKKRDQETPTATEPTATTESTGKQESKPEPEKSEESKS